MAKTISKAIPQKKALAQGKAVKVNSTKGAQKAFATPMKNGGAVKRGKC